MNARGQIWYGVAVWGIVSCWGLIAGAPLQAQQGWGDRSFDTSSYTDAERRWGNSGWLGNSGTERGWQLGVTTTNTDTGAVVRQVSPNSVASRAGIYPGDIIVCVAGDQVGRVGNQVYDLGQELNQHASPQGNVGMLVFDRRGSQLRSLQVQLDRVRSGLTGTIQLPQVYLPSDAVVTVRLQNETRPMYQVRNGEYSFRVPSYNNGTIPFEINYDPAYIASTDLYRLTADIVSGGRTLYVTERPAYVLTRGNPSTAQLTMRQASYLNPASEGTFVQAGYNPSVAYEQRISTLYRQYLGRDPSNLEMAAFYRTPDIETRIQRLPLDLMATEEFFLRSGGSNVSWVQSVFTQLVGQTPSQTEFNLWMQRFAELRYSRTELLNQLNMQARR